MRRLISIILLPMMVLMVLPSQAQDGGLSDEQFAFLERLLVALNQPYTSYTLEQTSLSTQLMTITIPNEFSGTAIQINSRVVKRTKVGDNTRAEVVATTSYQEPGSASPFSYSIDAEIRRVDETLYVNAAYVETLADLPVLPIGWVVIEQAEDWPELNDIALADYLPITPQSSPTLADLLAQDRALVGRIISDIQYIPATLTDGTPIDIIILQLDFHAMMTSEFGLDYSVSTLDAVILDALLADADIEFSATFTLNTAGQVIGQQVALMLKVEAIDAAALSADIPVGTTLGLNISQTENSFYSQINDPTLPIIEAPLDAP